mmetsp:Transcript_30491/g.34239  ORF Transcript_30491/g.34239 Transcript_30491/m.34239 type:complete len:226 (+) Transcript_30491:735-1412(+)
MIIEDAPFILQDPVVIHVGQIDHTQFIGGHFRRGKEMSLGKPVPLQHHHRTRGTRNGRDIRNLHGIELQRIETIEFFKHRSRSGSTIPRHHSIHAHTRLLLESRVPILLLNKGSNATIVKTSKSFVPSTFVDPAVPIVIHHIGLDTGTGILFQVGNRAVYFVARGRQKFVSKLSPRTNIGSTDKRREYNASLGIHHEHRGHVFITDHRTLLMDDRQTLGVHVASR